MFFILLDNLPIYRINGLVNEFKTYGVKCKMDEQGHMLAQVKFIQDFNQTYFLSSRVKQKW